jgi:spore coat protein U-like protein
MKSAKLLLGLGALGVLLVGAVGTSQGATQTANLGVSASIAKNCTISTTAVTFAPYDPVTTNATAPDDSTAGAVTITCTKGATTTIGLGLGANASGTQMRMTDGSNNYLNYALYSDGDRSAVWGNAAPNLVTPAAAPDRAARSFTVYGRIPGNQDLPAGTYTDTVVATVNF